MDSPSEGTCDRCGSRGTIRERNDEQLCARCRTNHRTYLGP